MKAFTTAILIAAPMVSAFAPIATRPAFTTSTSALSAKPPGAAKSKEEDLQKTIKVIMDHLDETLGAVTEDEVPAPKKKAEAEE
jgi:hypothetical protein